MKSKPFWQRRSTLLGMLGFIGGLTAAITAWSQGQDWKVAFSAGVVALLSAMAVTLRDALAKLEEATVASNEQAATRVENAIAETQGTRMLGQTQKDRGQ